jgi:hypothetical protein
MLFALDTSYSKVCEDDLMMVNRAETCRQGKNINKNVYCSIRLKPENIFFVLKEHTSRAAVLRLTFSQPHADLLVSRRFSTNSINHGIYHYFM